jgi:hypothetical protein
MPCDLVELLEVCLNSFWLSCLAVKAAVSALQQLPSVNAVIDGDDIIYRDYVDISIAVGTAKVRQLLPLQLVIWLHLVNK